MSTDFNAEVSERQAARMLRPLADRGSDTNRYASDIARRERLAYEFGEWIAHRLGPWDWFINPISFRDRHPDLERNPKTGMARRFRTIGNYGRVRLFVADPRLKSWEPSNRNRVEPKPPVRDKALDEFFDWLARIQEAAAQPIRAVVAEEFGRVGGRYHCHVLISGVAHLRRDEWWRDAFERFGRTRIEPFDPERGAAFYAAKYAAKALGALHFVGPYPGEKLTAHLRPGVPVGRSNVALSADLPRAAYRLRFEKLFGSRWNRGKR